MHYSHFISNVSNWCSDSPTVIFIIKNIEDCEELGPHVTLMLGVEIGTFTIKGNLAILLQLQSLYVFTCHFLGFYSTNMPEQADTGPRLFTASLSVISKGWESPTAYQ